MRKKKIKILHQEHKNVKIEKGNNLGFAKSFLTALDECDEADYYAFSDQDDVWEKDKLSTAMDCGGTDRCGYFFAGQA